MPLRFVFALHNHQPVGNFGAVFEQAFRDGYQPFLDLIAQHEEIAVTLHTSGCLLEWLVEHQPDYVSRLRELVKRGQVEIMGGGFFEPILPAIPRRDRLGQIRSYTQYLEEKLGSRVRGAWLAERVWEPGLVTDLVEASIQYTLLDDYHFKQAGLEDDQLFGYHLCEDEGRLLRVFPICETLRYLVPWKDPQDSIDFLRHVAGINPNAVVVCADDGEKFGAWPETHKHVFTEGWLARFFERLKENREWIEFCTLSQVIEDIPAAGSVYLPDCSYREMTEWALPTPRLTAYYELVRKLDQAPRGHEVRRFLRGGFWRNFLVKYPESWEMYCRMLEVSERVDRWESMSRGGPAASGLTSPAPSQSLSPQRAHLYRAQCNCSYWHGAFGGVYLPHLRNAVYRNLIDAENEVASSGGRTIAWLDARIRDFNLDTKPEVCLSSAAMAAYIIPHRGGTIYELDLRTISHNLLATMSRRPEAYHETIQRVAGGEDAQSGPGLHENVRFKHEGLERQLLYDPHPRKALIDHFFEPDATLDDVATLKVSELGDFVSGLYSHQIKRDPQGVQVDLSRSGNVAGHTVRLTKCVRVEALKEKLILHYRLENLSADKPLRFAVEFNFAGLAANEPDRYFYHFASTTPELGSSETIQKAGQLQTLKDVSQCNVFGIVDEWLGLDVFFQLAEPGDFWAFPIQTVSQSEGGFELVHQSNVVMPHWLVQPNSEGVWEIKFELNLDTMTRRK